MANKKKNPNSILFLYEGETEKEFYKKIFELKLNRRDIKQNFGNLNGIFSLNEKVKSKIQSYLANSAFNDYKSIHVFVAIDREGERHIPCVLNKEVLLKEFSIKNTRIASINEIVATQDLESWFFYDLNGIYKFIKVPVKSRNLKAYPNIEKTNNRILSDLFHKYKKHYQKGKRAEGFIDSLDLNKIYDKVEELKKAFEIMRKL